MCEYLEFTHDKFNFRVATDRVYHAQGVWAKAVGKRVTVGVSDYFQQHNGDVAFVEVVAVDTAVVPNQTIATIETIKVDIELPAPLSGKVVAVNDALDMEAELINAEPYGAGWLLVIEADNWAVDQTNLMTPAAYLLHMQNEIRAEGAL